MLMDPEYFFGQIPRVRQFSFLEYLSSLVLSDEQQQTSRNIHKPVYMILMIGVEIFFMINHIKNTHTSSVFWSAHCAVHLVILIFLGIPLETAYGTLRMGSLYFCAQCYASLIVSIIDNSYSCIGTDAACFAMITLHFTNIIQNWSDFTMKYTRLTAMLLTTLPIFIFYFNIRMSHSRYARFTKHPEIGILASCWLGFLFAVFWFHNKPYTFWWRNMTIILVYLLGFIILVAKFFPV